MKAQEAESAVLRRQLEAIQVAGSRVHNLLLQDAEQIDNSWCRRSRPAYKRSA